MVVDPNGQVSVSYLNASGKTIATALAGNTPPNLHALPSNNTGTVVTVTNELITSRSFARNAAAYSLTASATFLAPVTGDYEFDYNVDVQRLDVAHGPDGTLSICNTCYYDLVITVKDGCDEVLETKRLPAGFVFDTTCTAPTALTGTFTVPVNKIGEYFVSYELKVSNAALDFYDREHIRKNTDLKKIGDFLLEELKAADFTGCYSNCETCKEDLGEKGDFNAYFKRLYSKDSIPFTIKDSLWVNQLYDSLYASCEALQSAADCGTGPCDERLALLKADVSPTGQYALIDSTWQFFTNLDGENDSTLVYSFRNDGTNLLFNYTGIDFTDESGFLDYVKNSAGLLVPVKELTQDEFIKNWKDVWADSLVTRHPEYCYYLWCIANPGSYAFDEKLVDFDDVESAIQLGYFDSARVKYAALLDHDPFFNAGGLGVSLKSRMSDSLRLFSRTLLRYGVPDKNILQFIDVTLYCNDQSNGWQSCLPPGADCRSSYQEWLLYRNLYVNLKRKFYEEARRTSDNPVFANCANCYIGKDALGLGMSDKSADCGSLDSLVQSFQQFRSELDFTGIAANKKITQSAKELIKAANALVEARNTYPNTVFTEDFCFDGTNLEPEAKLHAVRLYTPLNRFHTIAPLSLQSNQLFGPTFPTLQANTILPGDFCQGSATSEQLNEKYYAVTITGIDSFFHVIWSVKNSGAYYYYGVSSPLSNYIPPSAPENHSFVYEFIRMDGNYPTIADYNNARAQAARIPLDSILHIRNLRYAFENLPVSYSSLTDNLNFSYLKVTLDMKNGTSIDAHMRAGYEDNFYVRYKEQVNGTAFSNDCNEAFTAYFNSRRGTNFTYTQIDSFYRATCGAMPDVCSLNLPFTDSTTCNYACPGGVYVPADRNGVSFYVQYGKPTVAPTGVPAGYGQCQFYNIFDLQTAAGGNCRFFNVWVCVKDSTSLSQSCQVVKKGLIAYEQGKDEVGNNLPLGGRDPHYQYAYDGINYSDAYTIDHPWNAGQSYWIAGDNINHLGFVYFKTKIFVSKEAVSLIRNEHYQDDGAVGKWVNGVPVTYNSGGYVPNLQEGWNEIVWKVSNTLGYVGFGSKFISELVGNSYLGNCSIPSNCADNPQAVLFKDKIRRYPDYVNTDEFIGEVLSNNPVTQSNANAVAIITECQTSCEAQADNWIAALSDCQADETKLAQLRTAFIQICQQGCVLSNGTKGASTLPAGSTPYESFEAAIVSILGAGAVNDSCTAGLINTPYPYNRQPFDANRVIYRADYDICNKVGQYRTQYAASGFTGNFHQYLEQLLKVDYQLDSTDLANLIKSCTDCNGILKEPIVLPIAFEPAGRPCLDCNGLQQLLSSFNVKYNITATNPRYETLLTNYFNHGLGFSLTYADYKDFLDSCAANPGGYAGRLCDQPVSPEIEDNGEEGNPCTADLFNTALENAYIEYNRYIDSVHIAFREAYLTKCLNVQANLKMTADLYEYHYTLYYYDQSGNLVKTIPPEGVNLLGQPQIDSVQLYRKLFADGCYQYSNYLKFNPSGTTPGSIDVYPGNWFTGTDPAHPNASTVEMWIKPGNNANQGIFSHAWHYLEVDTFYMGASLSLVNNRLRFYNYYFYQNPWTASLDSAEIQFESIDLNGKLRQNEWNHVAMTNRGDGYRSVRLFLNGQEITGNYLKDTLEEHLPVAVGMWGFNLGKAYTWNGIDSVWTPEALDASNLSLKQLRIYEGMLSPSQIMQNAFSNCLLPASQTGLRTWLPLNELSVKDFTTPYTEYSRSGDVISGSDIYPIYPHHRLPTTYVYNSLNQVIRQSSPDGGESQFWYDRLGRLTASQNAEQKEPSNNEPANRYSYTKYDGLGRITEVGEKTGVTSDMTHDAAKNIDQLKDWLTDPASTNKQVTKTLYDNPVNLSFQTMANSRKRVVASVYLENALDAEGDSTLYAYDLTGNVKTLVQHVKALVAADPDNGKKRMDYQYDLVSGKVNKVVYQKGRGDQFYYQYGYDAENRVVSAQTSRDGLVWTEDARYRYYMHGPLARKELGHYKVQGTDYAYTLQGWLKGINSDALTSANEMGGDGEPATIFSKVSKDVYAFKLGYFSNDYQPIGGGTAPAFGQMGYIAPGSLANTGNQLYNGNISYTTLALSKIDNGATAGYSYGYDQLNRLREMRCHSVSGAWSNSNIISAYSESIAYDANGNILKYLRNGPNTAGNPLDMDSLTFRYNWDSEGRLLNNKLDYVRDAVGSSNYTLDIDNQAAGNYSYDKIGNLVQDNAENLISIDWTAYGKIKAIVKTGNAASQITYGYDPSGNRTMKAVNTNDTVYKTFYVRDGQGNMMGLYTQNNSGFIRWEEQHLAEISGGIWRLDTIVPISAPIVQGDGEPIFDSVLFGGKVYSLTNHLGNVLVTISDKKLGHNDGNGYVDYYEAVVLSTNDYYPFGMPMPLRGYALHGVADYRYGFNGKENDLETGWQDYGFRIYDPRLGRFLSVDPLADSYPWFTPYQFAGNMPIWAVDIDGLEPDKNVNQTEAASQTEQVKEGSALENVTVTTAIEKKRSFFGWLMHKADKIANYIPVVGPIKRAVQSGLKGEWESVVLNLGEAVLDGVGLASGGVGNVVKTALKEGLKTGVEKFGAKALKNLVSETVDNYVTEETGISPSAAGAILRKGPKGPFNIKNADDAADDAAKTTIQLTKKKFGHTFTTHGEEMTDFLTHRAKGSGQAQGQFLDNQAAAKFIEDNLDKLKNGAISLPIPDGFPARMIKPDGTFGVPTTIKLVPGGKGVKTAYPEF
ncbi:MAG TPA: RHS repeat-associated core domain-containing protein [Flavisolibacter sp.]|nr:RHS repeat-associated core domain-containing protein [Flavisolibacter sp.]